MVNAYNSSTQETRTGEFETSLGYITRTYLRRKERREGKEKKERKKSERGRERERKYEYSGAHL